MERNRSLLEVKPFHYDVIINVGKVILGEQKRNKLQKDQRYQEKVKVKQAACALLNSGGGMIEIEMANEEEHSIEMGCDLEEALRELIESRDFHSFFETKQQSGYFYIFVKSWSSGPFSRDSSLMPRICSLSSSLYYRSETSVKLMNSEKAFRFLNEKKSNATEMSGNCPPRKNPRYEDSELDSPNKVFQRDRFEYGEILPFPESRYVEFKQFSTKNIEKYLKCTISEYIPAFANEKGGYLFIGVDDKSKEVLGCPKENVNIDKLSGIIEESISKLHTYHFCDSRPMAVDYESKIINVFKNGILHSFLCIIQVKAFCCAVFSGNPSSWIVKDNEVCSLTSEKWVQMMMGDTNPELSEDFESQLNISESSPSCRPVYTKKGLKHKKDLQQQLFPVKPGSLLLTPTSLWTELCSEHEGLQELMNNQLHPFFQGVLILSRSWAVDLSLKENKRVLCDALLIAQNSPPILYTILGEQDADGWFYCTKTAFTLKQKLVNMGGYTKRLIVIPKLLHLCPESNVQSLRCLSSSIDYPKSYNLVDTCQMEALLQSLVVVMLGFRSFLSDQLGCEVLNLLTLQQYELISKNLRKHRELFIHGFPGTGKTIIALKIIEKIRNVFHCETNDILYVCENQPLRNFVGNKKICRAETRKKFMNDDYENIQHIIMDEAQNFRTEDGDWYAKAKAITQKNKNCPGILWIFLDYFQTSHTEDSGLPNFLVQNSKEELTKVVRNSDQVAKFLQKEIDRVRRKPPDNIPLGSLEMLHEVEWVQGVQGTLTTETNLTLKGTVDYVAQTCKSLFERGYSAKDVAVLLSTTKDLDFFYRKLRMKMRMLIGNASNLQNDHIVLDSVRRFSGLERTIVFGIHPHTADPTILGNFLVCLASRANKHLYILWHNVQCPF
ncbi:schlafen family member 11 [Suncus etruscus]|uniref:schlafen family member 11 n=1 Tax=Suncus etruscus TaxID=109475 RepID=UPI00210F656F|nr:schlafen family member 11 [Suncus etruscus]